MPRQWADTISRLSLVLFFVSASTLYGQAPQPPAGDAEAAKIERARVLKEMHLMADAIVVRKQGRPQVVQRIDAPIFRYNSPSRLYQDGSIWAWGKQGRPLVIMEMFTLNARKPAWIQGCVLTSTELVEARRLDENIWYPREIGVQFKPFPATQPPAESENVRLRQMKQLSRRFKAHQFWGRDNSRFELRLLVNPVHRYNDPDRGLVDGSVFLMAHEIEPEAIIMIEAVNQGGEMTWQYAVTPIGSAEFHIFLDDNQVYQRGRTPMNTGYPIDPYHSFHVDAPRP